METKSRVAQFIDTKIRSLGKPQHEIARDAGFENSVQHRGEMHVYVCAKPEPSCDDSPLPRWVAR